MLTIKKKNPNKKKPQKTPNNQNQTKQIKNKTKETPPKPNKQKTKSQYLFSIKESQDVSMSHFACLLEQIEENPQILSYW